MRTFFIYTSLCVLLLACEDIINPDIPEAPSILVIDAFLDNTDTMQSIRITLSQSYFDNSPLSGVAGASVIVKNSSGVVLDFAETSDGIYQWDPKVGGPLAVIGDSLNLMVAVGENQLSATSIMNRVPDIDSVTFRFEEEDLFLPDSYFAEFWSRDPLGAGDTYWIKAYKNGEFLNQPNEINIAFDAGFSESGNVDGLIFIPPIRDAVNPFEQDENDKFLSPYEDGDSLYVEIHSINKEAFYFLNEMRIQTDRPGGFAELFATPLSNVSTNIINTGGNKDLVIAGFFNVAAVVNGGKKLDITQVPKGN